MLGVRGQVDLDHYENRLKLVLGAKGYRCALELLTEAAVNGGKLARDSVMRYTERTPGGRDAIADVLRILEHDGYLERWGDGHRFVSDLLEDWWRARHGRYFVPVAERPNLRHSGE